MWSWVSTIISGRARFALSAFLLAITGTGFGLFVWPQIELHMALRSPGGPEPEHANIVMLGDSHTQFVNWRRLMRCQKIANLGVGGNTTQQMLNRLPSVLAEQPKLVFVMAGTNDAAMDIPMQSALHNLDEIDKELSEHGIRVVTLSPPPYLGGTEAVREFVETATLKIPFSKDDLLADKKHIRRSGYAKWRDTIASLVLQYCD